MSFFSIAAFSGTGLGPAVSGYIELKVGWRWIQVRSLPSLSSFASLHPLTPPSSSSSGFK
jgi:MFS family permease